MTKRRIVLAMTGASGAPYALMLLKELLAHDCQVEWVYSKPAQVVLGMESEIAASSSPTELQANLCAWLGDSKAALKVYGLQQWNAPIASGSGVADAMVVCPCSMGSLAAIAQGTSENLIHRAADVCIKEGKKLVLVPRETPFSAIHLRNMHELAQLGVVILPPNPAFYQGVETIDDLLRFVVARILDQLGIDNRLSPRWGEPH